jgi:formylmethanofuran dehydrogenase subunit A
MRYLRDGDIERAANYVAWMMKTHKTYGIKCVNPAGVENWGWARNVGSLDEANIHFDISPREIIHGLCEINELLGMPMSMHLHCNNLGQPGCCDITRESLAIPNKIKANQNLDVEWAETKIDSKRMQSVYLTHAQFNSFGGTSWGDFESGTKDIIDYVNKTDFIVMDSGCVPFGEATVMTGDGITGTGVSKCGLSPGPLVTVLWTHYSSDVDLRACYMGMRINTARHNSHTLCINGLCISYLRFE